MKANHFQSFVAIDWSGAKGARHGGIAVALCRPGNTSPELVYPERRWSRQDVLDWLRQELPQRAIVGLDLSPGLPFADEGAYFPGWEQSPPDAKALWRMVDTLSADDDHLAATSFVANAQARRHFRHAKDDCGDLFQGGAGRMRLTEQRQRKYRLNPSSCFNLVGAAQVGKSSLTGMRVLHQLAGAIPVWPFDASPDTGSVIVEIYTSLAAREAMVPAGRSKLRDGAALDLALENLGSLSHAPFGARYTDHATDAILTAAWLRVAAGRTDLWCPAGLTPKIAKTEGWTFGVA